MFLPDFQYNPGGPAQPLNATTDEGRLPGNAQSPNSVNERQVPHAQPPDPLEHWTMNVDSGSNVLEVSMRYPDSTLSQSVGFPLLSLIFLFHLPVVW